MAFLESKLEQSFEFALEPAVVAEACLEVIKSLNLTIKNVSRETGIITARGTERIGWGERFLTLKISKTERGTSVSSVITGSAGIYSTGVAQRFLANFSEALSKNPTLGKASMSGW
ncbi:MAG TPA: hypothetical protein VKI62_08005, partial [Bacteroidota bacterium]|nr:hypothetical protein [Bacteroidota bacterium]